MEDVSEKLLKLVQSSFNSGIEKDSYISNLMKRAKNEKLVCKDAEILAKHLGDILSDALKSNIKQGVLPDDTMYWNIAKSVIEPMLKQNHSLLTDVNTQIQKQVYSKMGVSLNPKKPNFNQKRSDILMNSICKDGRSLDETLEIASNGVKNFTFSMSDDFIEENARSSANVGFKTVVIREIGSESCEWCSEREGEYDYEEVRNKGNPVWQRHIGCDCVITFKSERITQTVRNYSTEETRKKYSKKK